MSYRASSISRASRRRTYRSFFLAAAACGVTSAASSNASAGLLIDVRAISPSSPGGAKSVIAIDGSTVTLGVFARISGTNSVQQVGDFFGSGGPDTRNDDALQLVTGSFQSVGLRKGDFSIAGPGPLTYNASVSPFTGSGTSNGIASDWDGDGDLDIGGNTTDKTNMWAVRANTPSSATFGNGGTAGKGWSFGSSGAATSGGQADDTIINATTQELRIGTLRFVLIGGGESTPINFLMRPGADAGIEWYEDGILTAKTPSTGTFSVGTPVMIFVPEPAGISLLSFSGLGLLARRRRGGRGLTGAESLGS